MHARLRDLTLAASLLLASAARAQIGFVDGAYWANGSYVIAGWACQPGYATPLTVSAYDAATGARLVSTRGNDPSEPAVGAACGVPWATALRYHLVMPAWVEEAHVNQPIVVKASSLYWPYGASAVTQSGVFRYPDNAVRGYVDGVGRYGTDQAIVSGWACARGVAQSIWVHLYAGGPAGTGQFVAAAFANQWSEPAVASACGVGSGAYRYSLIIPFGPDVEMTLGGLKAYVHGISPIGASNLLLTNSGAFTLPGQRATVTGGCGYVPAAWNAPYGSIVLSRSNGGPIRPVIDAIGEHYTHSMLSLGTTGIVHAEMKTPDQNSWPSVCSVPLNPGQLQYGYPGVEQIDLGGAYADLQNEEITPAYQWGDAAATAAIAGWIAGAPQTVAQSSSDPGMWFPRKLRNATPISYSLYQYRNIEQTNQLASDSQNNGMVCSTFLSWIHVQAGAGEVPTWTYPHMLIASAADALATNVQRECNAGFGTWGSLLHSIVCPFYDVCENAGDQVTNCMAANACATDDNSIWHGVRDDPAATATSISPDRLAGLPPHGAGTSVWSYDQAYHPIAWNAPGAQYGCWY